VVVNIAVEDIAFAPGDAAGGDDAVRVGAHHPADEVDVVEVLLDDLVAADPDEGIPVAVFPLHVAPFGVAPLNVEDGTGEVVRVARLDVADGPVLDLLHRLDIILL